jgi:predicted DNA-binding transcriptional regulator AlpA
MMRTYQLTRAHQMTFQISNAAHSVLQHFDSLPDASYIRLPVVKGLLGCSIATVWRWSRDGTLPTPRKLSPRVTAWNVGELRVALAKLAA